MSEPVYGPTNPDPVAFAQQTVKRFGAVIELCPDKEAEYRALHADAWPGNLEQLHASNIRNFMVYTAEVVGRRLLFSTFEYIGTDFEADMAALETNPETQRWWEATGPCQVQLPGTPEGEQWLPMERLFQQPEA